jgi:hypothetical protein
MSNRFKRSTAVFIIAGVGVAVGLANAWAVRWRAMPTRVTHFYLDPPTAEEKARWRAEREEQKRIMKGGEFHDPLFLMVNYPGVEQPDLVEIGDIDLPGDTEIVGVEVDGHPCAFVLDKMKDPARHIVNLVLNRHAVSVTYCDLVDCVRVLSDESKTPLPLHVGGLDVNRQMVFLYKGNRYGQQSAALPLTDYPYSRTTLGDWIRHHPNTRVCVPPNATDA